MGEIVKDTCYMEMANGRQLSAKGRTGEECTFCQREKTALRRISDGGIYGDEAVFFFNCF